MWNELLNNLMNIGFAMLIFLCSYLANMAFSLWYNIKILNQEFDKEKLYASGLKIPCFRCRPYFAMYCNNSIPIFANQVGWEIPDNTRTFSQHRNNCSGLLVSSKYIRGSLQQIYSDIKYKQ